MEHSIKLSHLDLTLQAVESGPKDGAPVFCLHGWLDNAGSFAPLAALMPELRLFRLDMTGHGRSDHLPPAAHYSMLSYVEQIFAAADALGFEQFHLLAHSMGACIASLMAGVFPERIRSLILIEGLGPFSLESSRCAERLSEFLTKRKRIDSVRLPQYETLEASAQARAASSEISFDAAVILSERGTRRVGNQVTWRTDPRLRLPSAEPLTEDQISSFLRRITAPTLLLKGETGFFRSLPRLDEREALVSNLEIDLLKGGHHLHMEEAAPVAARIRRFYSRLS